MCAELLWLAIYWAESRPNSGSQSSSWFCRGLSIWAPCIIRYYNLATVVAIRMLTQQRMFEMGSSRFPAISRLKFVTTMRASFSRIPFTESKNVEKYIAHGSVYHFYLYFPYPIKPVDFLLVPSCRYLCPSLQIWRRLWHQSVFIISPRWVRHRWSPIRFPPDLPPHLIFCSPSVLGVHRVHSEMVRLVNQGRGSCHTLHCDIRWQVFHSCS